MTDLVASDACIDCWEAIDVTKRNYRTRGGLWRCARCQVLLELEAELVTLANLATALELEKS